MSSDHLSSAGTDPLGTIESTTDRFVWSPPLTGNAIIVRRRLRATSAMLVVLTSLWAGASVWADGLDAVAFALIVPLILFAVAVLIDRLFAVGGRLRLEVDGDALVMQRGKRRDVVPRHEIAGVAIRSKSVDDRSSPGPPGWYVVIERVDGPTLSAIVPVGMGSAFDRHEALRLEATLRRRCLG